MNTANAPQPGSSDAPSGSAFFVVATDPEIYSTMEATDVVAAWMDIMFCPSVPRDRDDPEVVAFEEYASEPDNWHLDPDGNPALLIWDVGGEGGGQIRFYRIDHDRPNAEVSHECPPQASAKEEI